MPGARQSYGPYAADEANRKYVFSFNIDRTKVLWDNMMTRVTIEAKADRAPKGVHVPSFSLPANRQRFIHAEQKRFAADIVDAPRPLWNQKK
mmetsp:Transcript_24853/g.62519  ORF Transcript_24853/g.62519 Transcript_24853/m.62519 type:complete len:92 (-) Transcript_24853:59-334(-)